MRKITLMARIRKGDSDYAFERVVTERNGKPVPPMEPENATAYYYRFTENGKQVMKAAGKIFADAVRQLRNKEIELECIARGVAAPPSAEGRRTIADAAEQFIKKQVALDKAPFHGLRIHAGGESVPRILFQNLHR